MTVMTTMNIPTEAELASYRIIAKTAATSPHWRKLGGGGDEESIVATILSVMLLARELGVSPMQAISGGINNIQGKFEISARIMNQLIRKHGHELKVKLINDNVCTIWGRRRDTGEEMEVSYHIEEARTAGLIKTGGGWTKNPQDMLFARCISRIARRLTPDCIGGCYVEGELQETVLKEPVTTLDLPQIKEMKMEEVVLQLPEDLNPELVEQFFKESSEKSNCPVSDLKKRAAQNFDKFLSVCRSWQANQIQVQVAQIAVGE